MKIRITSAAFFLPLCIFGICHIQYSLAEDVKEESPLPRDLGSLKLGYEVKISELQKPLNALAGSYEKRLNTIAAELQKRGDLSGVLAVRNEIDALKKSDEGTPKSGEPRALATARSLFLKTRKNLNASILRKSEPFARAYRKKLEYLKSEYTKKGEIGKALTADKLIETIHTPKSFADSLNGKRKLKIKVRIDGTAYLKMRGNEIWYDHTKGSYAPPGLAGRDNGDLPTTLDSKIEWKPKWEGKVSGRYKAGITLPTSGEGIPISLRMSDGRGFAKVIQNPSKDNDFTATIEMRDENEKTKKPFYGSDWMEFRLSW